MPRDNESLATSAKRKRRRRCSPTPLRVLQRWMLSTILQPLDDRGRLPPVDRVGRRLTEEASRRIRPAPLLSPSECLEVYAQCYWSRALASLSESCTAIRALLGEQRFTALTRAYLLRYPSRSFTLRNLSRHFASFILEQPAYTAPHTALAHDVATVEWATLHAADAGSVPPVAIEYDESRPTRARFRLQPYLTLLALEWPADSFVTRANSQLSRRPKRCALPGRRKTFVVVHRYRDAVYYKRIRREEFLLLQMLSAQRTLPEAVAAVSPRLPRHRLRALLRDAATFGWIAEMNSR